MTESEKIQYNILRFLNQSYVRVKYDITDFDLMAQADSTNNEVVIKAINGLAIMKMIERIPPNNGYKITEFGEHEYNRLSSQIKISKSIDWIKIATVSSAIIALLSLLWSIISTCVFASKGQ